jgi:hypothetical protein
VADHPAQHIQPRLCHQRCAVASLPDRKERSLACIRPAMHHHMDNFNHTVAPLSGINTAYQSSAKVHVPHCDGCLYCSSAGESHTCLRNCLPACLLPACLPRADHSVPGGALQVRQHDPCLTQAVTLAAATCCCACCCKPRLVMLRRHGTRLKHQLCSIHSWADSHHRRAAMDQHHTAVLAGSCA